MTATRCHQLADNLHPIRRDDVQLSTKCSVIFLLHFAPNPSRQTDIVAAAALSERIQIYQSFVSPPAAP